MCILAEVRPVKDAKPDMGFIGWTKDLWCEQENVVLFREYFNFNHQSLVLAAKLLQNWIIIVQYQTLTLNIMFLSV